MSASTGYAEMTADIVSAYVSNNAVQASGLPELIKTVHEALVNAGQPQQAVEAQREPAVNPKRSVTPDYIISLFDGKKYRTLKRHLRTQHNMTPEQYRLHWGLPPDYPMVAPNYSDRRSELAKSLGLGRKAGAARSASKRGKKAVA